MKYRNYSADGYRNSVIILVVTLVVLIIMLGLQLLFATDREIVPFIIIIGFVLVLLLSPGIVICMIFYIHYRDANYIHVQSTTFNVYHFKMKSYALEGCVTVNGQLEHIRTTHSFTYFNFKNYLNRQVTVGYDPSWHKWVVFY